MSNRIIPQPVFSVISNFTGNEITIRADATYYDCKSCGNLYTITVDKDRIHSMTKIYPDDFFPVTKSTLIKLLKWSMHDTEMDKLDFAMCVLYHLYLRLDDSITSDKILNNYLTTYEFIEKEIEKNDGYYY